MINIDDIKEQIKREFKRQELNYLDAIMELQQQLNMAPKDAEALVEHWEDES
jgi:hypothetical protein